MTKRTGQTETAMGRPKKVIGAVRTFKLAAEADAFLANEARRTGRPMTQILEACIAKMARVKSDAARNDLYHPQWLKKSAKLAAALAICWHLRHHDHNAVMMAVTCIALPKPIDRLVHQLWEHRTGWKIAAILSVWVASALMLL